ncbi:sensor histidine kinase [Burkholderia pseudomallei]|uniref:sensor histidine kinase VirA n=1 Tax=Burkholderia pseudomallei TaxID=28450 RepID=UPI000530CF30|nr:sensor histidine kinase VirA [Burkholderia pseudomallei]KGS24384.1 histidine kinase-, DNA gyrase B-, and HSP90-like ATPase family protein [Burkholderia pseudomallei MSHR7343]MBF3446672.1 MASE1 domain-containing protein [Burkholderia pseudomallei]MBF3812327.1 MASE1 domain-containing protein [Burkholderia pseudomallei]MBF3840873.1 MASE1 domain-containing protein [Burkholderia pseudomallei]OMS54025.1 histidine kinase [Burkholderia pseudomallei]
MHGNSIDAGPPARARPARITRTARAAPRRDDRAFAPGGALNAAGLLLLLFYANHLLSRPGACTSLNHTLSAVVWPAPVLGIALLLHCRRPLAWWLGAGSLFATLLAAGSLDWVPWHVDALFAAVNVVEAIAGAWLARRYLIAGGGVDTLRGFAMFVLLLPLGMAAMHATLAAAILSVWMNDREWLSEWSRAYAANALALLVLLPALLTWNARACGATWSRSRNQLPVLATFGSLCFASIWGYQAEVARALLALSLSWAALEGGLVLASQLNALSAIALIAMTLGGRGPYAWHHDGHGVWALQVDLIGVAILSMCIAIATGERRRLARQIERSRRFESLGFFAGGIVHDFSNVLTTIDCHAEYASERLASGARADDSIDEIHRAVERGRDLAAQILLAARRGEPVLTRVSVDEVVDEALAATRAAAWRGVEIVRCGDGARDGARRGDVRHVVFADRSQLARAVMNLVGNAVRAARATVVVRVGVNGGVNGGASDGASRGANDGGAPAARAFDVAIGEASMPGGVWIEVSDDGEGIDVEPLDRIFEPFYSNRSGAPGTGLGLAIVAGAALAHRGQIAVATDRGAGSCFRFTLPAAWGTGAPGAMDAGAPGAVQERT